ncbi:hypothetical protein [Lacipirellula sp.]|uniref:hypothetical protein n=1 Tax=Lacipirellula sp. TaxID=2691419 RepID=UPI003D131962
MADRPTISGDPCPECNGGRLIVYAGRDVGSLRVKYLCCDRCRAKPANNKIFVPQQYVARRRKTSESVLNNVQSSFDESNRT